MIRCVPKWLSLLVGVVLVLVVVIYMLGIVNYHSDDKGREILAYYRDLEKRLKDGDKGALLELADRIEGNYSPGTAVTVALKVLSDVSGIRERDRAKRAFATWIRSNYTELGYDCSSRRYMLGVKEKSE
ncbi:MAG: hypothetical protein DCC63_18630 [Nitrospira sp.]|nr:MAG: hypothetical protein DCC63_18630 [Nitrospira sp.]